MTALSAIGLDIADPDYSLQPGRLRPVRGDQLGPLLIESFGSPLRAEKLDALRGQVAAVLPVDRLFEIRVAAALRLWRVLSGAKPGADPAPLSRARHLRLCLGLRALDGRKQEASYRQLADVLFATGALKPEQWKTHPLRDQTIRLVRYATKLMQGEYRLLLRHPYRRWR